MEVLLNELIVAVVEAESPEVDFDRLPDHAFGTASGSVLQFRWDTPLTLALVGGASPSGNGLRILPLGVPDDVESLSAVAIDAAGFGSFEVSDLLAPVLDVAPRPQPSAGLALVLGQNPVRRGEALELTLVAANAEWIDLDLYDAQGRRVAALFHGALPAGLSRRRWTPAREVTSGLYFLRLRANGANRSEKVILIK
jgi:hypothetical protein